MTAGIEDWWPELNEQIRFWVVNNLFSPLAPYTLSEIESLGGPDAESGYWRRDSDGERYLPSEAVQRIIRNPDHDAMSRQQEPNSRAAYYRHSWPRR